MLALIFKTPSGGGASRARGISVVRAVIGGVASAVAFRLARGFAVPARATAAPLAATALLLEGGSGSGWCDGSNHVQDWPPLRSVTLGSYQSRGLSGDML
jgi:hypothetical protein